MKTQFRLKDYFSANYIGDECLILDARDGSCHILNETAGWLVSLAQNFIEVEKACEMAKQRYKINDEKKLKKDIIDAINQLKAKDIIDIK